MDSLSDFFINKDHTSIVLFLNKFINLLGGPISYMSTREISDICKGNCLTVFISATTANLTNDFFVNCKNVVRHAQQIICKNLHNITMSYYFWLILNYMGKNKGFLFAVRHREILMTSKFAEESN